MNENCWTVYAHINKINGKIYVGITSILPKYRWNNGNGYVQHKKFFNAIQKYGWENFEHTILEEKLTQDQASEMECYYIKKFDSMNNGYNCTEGGEGCVGYKHTDEAKLKMSKSRKGRKLSEDWRKHMSEAQKIAWAEGRRKPSITCRAVAVECEGITFNTIKECANFYNIKYSTMRNWLYRKRKMPMAFQSKNLKIIEKEI